LLALRAALDEMDVGVLLLDADMKIAISSTARSVACGALPDAVADPKSGVRRVDVSRP
jgi:hypothetical protein